ncbi:hypothetical protein L0244_06970 [bacterium]|nr:hypothetical protein [bacterium]
MENYLLNQQIKKGVWAMEVQTSNSVNPHNQYAEKREDRMSIGVKEINKYFDKKYATYRANLNLVAKKKKLEKEIQQLKYAIEQLKILRKNKMIARNDLRNEILSKKALEVMAK